MAYRHETQRDGPGFRYRVLDAETGEVVLTSGRFLLERDADNVGRHFVQDPDLGAYLNR